MRIGRAIIIPTVLALGIAGAALAGSAAAASAATHPATTHSQTTAHPAKPNVYMRG